MGKTGRVVVVIDTYERLAAVDDRGHGRRIGQVDGARGSNDLAVAVLEDLDGRTVSARCRGLGGRHRPDERYRRRKDDLEAVQEDHDEEGEAQCENVREPVRKGLSPSRAGSMMRGHAKDVQRAVGRRPPSTNKVWSRRSVTA